MSDITMMKGYGFPRGSGMDYAGYGAVPGGTTLVQRRGTTTPIDAEHYAFAYYLWWTHYLSTYLNQTNESVDVALTRYGTDHGVPRVGDFYGNTKQLLLQNFSNNSNASWATGTGTRARSKFSAVHGLPEPSIFSKIPALDGMGEEGSFGTEYTFVRERQRALSDMTLPTLDVETGEWTPAAQPVGGAGKGLAVGLGLLGLYLLFK